MGYRIKFYLDSYTIKEGSTRKRSYTFITNGAAHFFLMKPESKQQLKKWKMERKRAYNGSYRQFLSALTSHSLSEEGYEIRITKIKTYYLPTKPTNIQDPTKLYVYTFSGNIVLSFKRFSKDYKYLEVIYTKEMPEKKIVRRWHYRPRFIEISYIRLPHDKAIINPVTGKQDLHFRALITGYWGWTNRIPDRLPIYYGIKK